jgi:hypothetical protein
LFDDGSGSFDSGQAGNLGEKFVGEVLLSFGNELVGGASGNEIDGLAEGGEGSSVGSVDSHHNGNSEGDSQEAQASLESASEKEPGVEQGKELTCPGWPQLEAHKDRAEVD